jgi:hypothetical protein
MTQFQDDIVRAQEQLTPLDLECSPELQRDVRPCATLGARPDFGLSGLTFRTSGPPVSQACVAAVYLRGHMDQESLRLLILRKLRAGRLPRDGTRTVWRVQATGKRVDASNTVVAKTELLMEGVTLDLGGTPLSVARPTFPDLGSGKTRHLPSRLAKFAVHVPPRRGQMPCLPRRSSSSYWC